MQELPQICKEIYPHLVMDGVEYPITISNWAMLIKRSIIQEHGLSYREDILISEDAPFGSEVLYCANSFAYLKNQHLYHYRITSGSASKTHQQWWWDSSLKINEETENFFNRCTDYDFAQQIKSNMFYLARAEIYYILADKSLSCKEQNAKIRSVMNHPRVVRMMEGYDTTGIPLSFKADYWSIRYKSIFFRRMISLISSFHTSIKSIQL